MKSVLEPHLKLEYPGGSRAYVHHIIAITGDETTIAAMHAKHFFDEATTARGIPSILDIETIIPLPEASEQEILPNQKLEAVLGLAILDKPGIRVEFRVSHAIADLLPGANTDAATQLSEAKIPLTFDSIPELKKAILERYPNCLEIAERVLANYAAFGHMSLYEWKRSNWKLTDPKLPCVILQRDENRLEISLTNTTGDQFYIFTKLAVLYPDLTFKIDTTGINADNFRFASKKILQGDIRHIIESGSETQDNLNLDTEISRFLNQMFKSTTMRLLEKGALY